MFLFLLRALLIPKLQLALENVALRQQVAVLRRNIHRPRVRAHDRRWQAPSLGMVALWPAAGLSAPQAGDGQSS